MGPIDPVNALYWSTNPTTANWEVVEGTTLKQGIKMTTPFAYQRKLPIRWYMNSTQLTPTTPTIGGVSLSQNGGLRGEDAVITAPVAADSNKYMNYEID
eukprot:12885743-Prorocentrum_lima.AAC.1